MERSTVGLAREGWIRVENASLHYRQLGTGPALVVLHGGPDFDFNYLLPDLDRLSSDFRLITYDQRGRGRSADGVRPEDVTLPSEIADLDRVREHFHLDAVAVLGHSWGALLAMEYAIRHPDRVSHLILANTASASHQDFLLLRREIVSRRPREDAERMKSLAASSLYIQGDPETVASYYRVHFRTALKRPEHLERLMNQLTRGFTREGILKARAIEDRLYRETWLAPGYDLFPELRRLTIPTLVIHGDHDLIPVACAERVAEAIPGARFALLENCGHFPFLESPERFEAEIRGLVQGRVP